MKITFKIPIITYIFYILLILSGYINYLIILIVIMCFHELGHIITIKLLKYNIKEIIILPIGGIIKTDLLLNTKSIKLFLISISGVIFQILLFLLVRNTNTNNYNIFYNLNLSLIILNLIPIYPLDGYNVAKSIIENILKYKLSIKICNLISLLLILVLYIYTKNIIIFVVYYIINIKNILMTNYIYNKFILERYLYPKQYKKFKIIDNISNLYKNKKNLIKIDRKLINEDDYYKVNYSKYY